MAGIACSYGRHDSTSTKKIAQVWSCHSHFFLLPCDGHNISDTIHRPNVHIEPSQLERDLSRAVHHRNENRDQLHELAVWFAKLTSGNNFCDFRIVRYKIYCWNWKILYIVQFDLKQNLRRGPSGGQ